MEDTNKTINKKTTSKKSTTKKTTSIKPTTTNSSVKNSNLKKTNVIDKPEEINIITEIEVDESESINNNTIQETPSSNVDNQRVSRKRKLIDRNIEILVMNATNGGIFYRCPKTKNEYRLSTYGDSEYITIDELITMRNAHKKLLTKYYLVPIEIMDENITLDEALIYLGLDKLYDKEIYSSIINYEMDLDDIIFSNNFLERFKRFTNEFQLIIIERAVSLFKNNKLNDYNIIEFLNTFSGRDLFTK
jgi:hypothetical protein